jgi:hypothetical protein
MPSLDSDTCAKRGGYLFLPGFSSLYDAIHGWMTGRMDGKSFTTTTPFTICNSEDQLLVWWSSDSLPAQGHIHPFLQFSKSLSAEYDVDVTFFTLGQKLMCVVAARRLNLNSSSFPETSCAAQIHLMNYQATKFLFVQVFWKNP